MVLKSGVPSRLPKSEDSSFRNYSASYLALSCRGACNTNVNFSHGVSDVPFFPPRTFGAACSAYYKKIVGGHHGVCLTDSERRILACWIDLCVPHCGSYTEHNLWNEWYAQRFLYAYNKRLGFAWLELNEIRKAYGLAPVPLTGFVSNVAEPRRQNYWSE